MLVIVRLTRIDHIPDAPAWLSSYVNDAAIYDSSSSPEATAFFARTPTDDGVFIKHAPARALECEARMDRWFHDMHMGPEVIVYRTDDVHHDDWLVMRKVPGEDCTAPRYVGDPRRLCDTLASLLRTLHDDTSLPDPRDGTVGNVITADYLARAEDGYRNKRADPTFFTTDWGEASLESIHRVIERHACELESDTLIHGDYCLPNIILDDWRFSAFIDLDHAGIGDRHIDIYWALWTLRFNLHTNECRNRFIDTYGRERVDPDRLRLIGAIETFG